MVLATKSLQRVRKRNPMFDPSGIGWEVHTILIAFIVLSLLVLALFLRVIQRPASEGRHVRAAQKIEKLQLEKTEEIYRLAEFGRLNASLLHDIAAPLTAVSMNVSLLEDSSYPINNIREGVKSMEDYLASARLRLQGQNNDQTFSPLCEIKKVARLADAKIKISSSLDEAFLINGDSARFDQALSNLIANALDASGPKGSAGNVTISAITTDQNVLCVTVEDNGEGVKQTELEAIFRPFHTSKTSGVGLGLSIVKQIVEEFNGTVTVVSTVGKGSKFTLRIPYEH